MKKWLLVQLSILTLVLASGFAYSQESIVLKYNFVKGKSYTQSASVSNNMTQTMMGQEVKMLSDIIANSEMAIEGVNNDGSATTLFSFLNASIHSSAMGRDTTIQLKDVDSKKRVVYSTDGKQVSSLNLDSSKVNTMMGSLNQFSKLIILPGKSVKVGEKWQDKTVDSTAASGGNPLSTKTTSDNEYTLVGKESKDGKEYYKIAYSSTMTINGKGKMMGMEMFMEGTGKSEGFSYFDPKSSMVVYCESNAELDMSIAVSGQQNMTIRMTQSIKAVMKLEEK